MDDYPSPHGGVSQTNLGVVRCIDPAILAARLFVFVHFQLLLEFHDHRVQTTSTQFVSSELGRVQYYLTLEEDNIWIYTFPNIINTEVNTTE